MRLNKGYDKPGPGVAPDAPRRKGFARWWEVTGRDGGRFFMAGSLALLSALPGFAGAMAAILVRSAPGLLLAAALGGALFGPFWLGMVDAILRSLRDEAGYFWYTWKRVLRQNWLICLAPGGVFGLLYGVQLLFLLHINWLEAPRWQLVLLVISCLFTTELSAWVWPQVALLTLPLPLVVKNALLLTLAHPLQSVGAAAMWMLYVFMAALLYPVSLMVLFLTVWVPALTALLLVYRPLNATFQVEEGLKKLHESEP